MKDISVTVAALQNTFTTYLNLKRTNILIICLFIKSESSFNAKGYNH